MASIDDDNQKSFDSLGARRTIGSMGLDDRSYLTVNNYRTSEREIFSHPAAYDTGYKSSLERERQFKVTVAANSSGISSSDLRFGQDTAETRERLISGLPRGVLTTFTVDPDSRFFRFMRNRQDELVVSNRVTQPPDTSSRTLEAFNRGAVEAANVFGSRLHAKIGVFGNRWFVGTSNVTTSLDNKQFNYYVSGTDPGILQQAQQVVRDIRSNKAPTSTNNLIVTSPGNPVDGATQVLSLISQTRGQPLSVVSATLSSDRLISAFIEKARSGDQVNIVMGGVHPEDRSIQQMHYNRLSQASNLMSNLQVSWADRPVHVNALSSVGRYNLFAVGSSRFSKSAMGANPGTDVMLHGNSEAIAKDLTKRIFEVGNFSGSNIDEPRYSPLGGYLAMMTPFLTHPSAQKEPLKRYQYQNYFVVSPSTIFNARTRDMYRYVQRRDPEIRGTEQGMGFFAYLYKESYYRGYQKFPDQLPDVILRLDRGFKIPSAGERVRNWAAEKYGDTSLQAHLLEPRGNRGPLGTLFVNAGDVIDRALHAQRQTQVDNAYGYRSQDAKREHTFANVARFIDNNLFNLATGAATVKFSMTAVHYATGWLQGGLNLARTVDDRLGTWASKGSMTGATLHSTSGAIRQAAGVFDYAYRAVSQVFWGSQRGFYGIFGNEGKDAIDDVLKILSTNTTDQIVMKTKDEHLARRMASWRNLTIQDITGFYDAQGKEIGRAVIDQANPAAVKMTGTTTGHVATNRYFVVVDQNVKRSLVDVSRAVHARMSRFMETVPGLNYMADLFGLEPDHEKIAARHVRMQSYAALLKGDREEFKRLAQLSYDVRSSERVMPYTRLSPERVLIRKSIPVMFGLAIVNHAVGVMQSANSVTLEEQVDAGARIAYAQSRGRVQDFGLRDLKPQSMLEIPFVAFSALLHGISWSGQFLHNLASKDFLNPFAAARRATKMTSVITQSGASAATGIIGEAGTGLGPNAGVMDFVAAAPKFFLDMLTALDRRTKHEIYANREGLLFKVIDERIATGIMTTEALRDFVTSRKNLTVGQAAEQAEMMAMLDIVRAWSGNNSPVKVKATQSYGLRVGYLPVGSMWAGGIFQGDRWNFMVQFMSPIGSGVSFGIKLPVYWSRERQQSQFGQWRDSELPQDPSLINRASMALMNATGGPTGPVGSALQFIAGFGYQAGTPWEALMRTGAATLALVGESAPALLAMGYAGSMLYAHSNRIDRHSIADFGRSLVNFREQGSRFVNYLRTGEASLPGFTNQQSRYSFNFLKNLSEGVALRYEGSTGLARAGYTAAGAGLSFLRSIIDIPAQALVNIPSMVVGYGLQGATMGRFQYQTSRLAAATRGAMVGARALIPGLVLASGYLMSKALHQSRGHEQQYDNYLDRALAQLPSILRDPISGIIAKKDDIKRNPEEDVRFRAAILDGFAEEMGSQGYKGRYQGGIMGLADMFFTNFKRSIGIVKADELATSTELYGEKMMPLHRVVHEIDEDTIGLTTTKIGTPLLPASILSITASPGLAFTKQSEGENKNVDLTLALALSMSHNARSIKRNFPARQRPAFMGKMFMSLSPIHTASTSLRIAMSVRYNTSRAALGMNAFELQKYYGDYFYPSKSRKKVTNFVTYALELKNPSGGLHDSIENTPVKRYVSGLLARAQNFYDPRSWQLMASGVKSQFSGAIGISASYENATKRMTNDIDMEDDWSIFAALTHPLNDPSAKFLKAPKGAADLRQGQLNWMSERLTQVTAFAYFMLGPGAMFVATSTILGTFAVTSLRDYGVTLTPAELEERQRQKLAERIKRLAPDDARYHTQVRAGVLRPMANAAGEMVLTGTGAYRVEVPTGSSVASFGDAQGRFFTSTVDQATGNVLVSGWQKAQIVKSTNKMLLDHFRGIPSVRTAGEFVDSVQALKDRFSLFEHGMTTAGVTPTAEFIQAQKDLDHFRNLPASINLNRVSAIDVKTLNNYAEFLNRVRNRFNAVFNLGVIDGAMASQLRLDSVNGLTDTAIATMNMDHEAIPHVPGQMLPDEKDYYPHLYQNDSTPYFDEHNHAITRHVQTRTGAPPSGVRGALAYGTKSIFTSTPGKLGMLLGAGAAAGYGLSSVFGGDSVEMMVQGAGFAAAFTRTGFHMLNAAAATSIFTGVLAQSATNLTEEQKKGFASSAASGVGMLALAAAPAMLSLLGVPLLGVGIGAAAVAGAIGTAALFSKTARTMVQEAFSTTGAALSSMHSGIERAITAVGRAFPIPKSISNFVVSGVINTQLSISNALYGFEAASRSSGNERLSSFFRGLRHFQEMTLGLAPQEGVLQGPAADREGQSFTANNPLFASTSPIWWGNSSGIGWMLDAMVYEVQRQEAVRLSGEIGNASVLEMVAKETLDINSGNNYMPQHSLNAEARYMSRGARAGGFANVQERRAFRYVNLAAPDKIIQDELRRRGVLYEVGFLGNLMTRDKTKKSGFANFEPRKGPTGRAYTSRTTGSQGPAPAKSSDLEGAAGFVLSRQGDGPNNPSVRRWDNFIESSARKHGVPPGIIRALMSVESGGSPTAVSPVGAAGLMQVMPFHFKPGQKRFDPETNIDLGTKIFANYYRSMRNKVQHLHLPEDKILALAVASYNTGPNWKAYSKGQFPDSFDGNVTGKEYSDRVMAQYYKTVRSNRLVTAEQEERIRRALPEYLKLSAPGKLDEFLEKRGGVSANVAKQIAGRLRHHLHQQEKWLPQDSPTEWRAINPNLGRVPTAKDKAEYIMRAAGVRNEAYVLPVANMSKKDISGVFGEHRGDHMHSGVDIARGAGTQFAAIAEGLVTYAGTNGAYGKFIRIKHKDGMISEYGHASNIAVAQGDYVKANQLIGFVGSTGFSTGPHLHLNIIKNGAYVDPLSVLFSKVSQQKQEANNDIQHLIEENLKHYDGNQVGQILWQKLGVPGNQVNAILQESRRQMSSAGFTEATKPETYPQPGQKRFFPEPAQRSYDGNLGAIPALVFGFGTAVGVSYLFTKHQGQISTFNQTLVSKIGAQIDRTTPLSVKSVFNSVKAGFSTVRNAPSAGLNLISSLANKAFSPIANAGSSALTTVGRALSAAGDVFTRVLSLPGQGVSKTFDIIKKSSAYVSRPLVQMPSVNVVEPTAQFVQNLVSGVSKGSASVSSSVSGHTTQFVQNLVSEFNKGSSYVSNSISGHTSQAKNFIEKSAASVKGYLSGRFTSFKTYLSSAVSDLSVQSFRQSVGSRFSQMGQDLRNLIPQTKPDFSFQSFRESVGFRFNQLSQDLTKLISQPLSKSTTPREPFLSQQKLQYFTKAAAGVTPYALRSLNVLGLGFIGFEATKTVAAPTIEERNQAGFNLVTSVAVTASAVAAGMAAAPGLAAAAAIVGGSIALGYGINRLDRLLNSSLSQKFIGPIGAAPGNFLHEKVFDKTVKEPVKDEIVVVGDETPGIIAAVSAARSGAKVTLVAPLQAKNSYIGGLLTRGGLAYLDRNQEPGLPASNPYYQELMSRMGVKAVSFDPKKGNKVLREMLAEAGVKIIYKDHKNIKVTANDIIDATRSGTYARQEGAKFFRGFELAGPRGDQFTLAVSPIFVLKGMNVDDWLKLERKLDPHTQSYKGSDYLDVKSSAIGHEYHKWRKVKFDPALKVNKFLFDKGNIAILPDGSLSVNALLFGVGSDRAIHLSDEKYVPARMRQELRLVEKFFKEKVSSKVSLQTPHELYVRHTGNIETTDMVTREQTSSGPFVGKYNLDLRGIHGPGSLGKNLGGPLFTYRYGLEGTQVKGVKNTYIAGAAGGYDADIVGVSRIEEFNIGKAGLLGEHLAKKQRPRKAVVIPPEKIKKAKPVDAAVSQTQKAETVVENNKVKRVFKKEGKVDPALTSEIRKAPVDNAYCYQRGRIIW